MGPTLGMNVKLAHKHKVDTSYKGALFRAHLDSCELYYIVAGGVRQGSRGTYLLSQLADIFSFIDFGC